MEWIPVIRLMDKILHDHYIPKLWDLWYYTILGSCRILSINSSPVRSPYSSPNNPFPHSLTKSQPDSAGDPEALQSPIPPKPSDKEVEPVIQQNPYRNP